VISHFAMGTGGGEGLYSQMTPAIRSAQSSEERKLRASERSDTRRQLLAGGESVRSSQEEERAFSTRRVVGRKRLRVACDSSDEEEIEDSVDLGCEPLLLDNESERSQLSESMSEGDEGVGDQESDDDVIYVGTVRAPRGPPPVWAQTVLTSWLLPIVREYSVTSADRR
jgi:hypothetical protein